MKTSNKYLLGFFIFSLALLTFLVISFRSNLEKRQVEASGKQNSVSVSISKFEKLEVAGKFRVYFTQEEQSSLEIKGDSAYLENVDIKEQQGKLYVRTKMSAGNPKGYIKVYLSNPHLTNLKLEAGSRFKTKNLLKQDSIDLSLSAGAELDMELQAILVNLDASAGVDVELEGSTDIFNLEGLAGVKIEADEFKTRICKAELAAGAKAELYVSDTLTGGAAAASKIEYKGNPKFIDVEQGAAAEVKGN